MGLAGTDHVPGSQPPVTLIPKMGCLRSLVIRLICCAEGLQSMHAARGPQHRQCTTRRDTQGCVEFARELFLAIQLRSL